jgi:competence protein ComEC
MAVAEADSTRLGSVKGAGLVGVLSEIWSAEAGRLTVWSPLLLVVGIWTYFGLATEPQAWVGWFLLLAALIVIFRFSHARLALVVALVCLGFGTAKIRTDMVATPLLRAYAPGTEVTGNVADVDLRSRGSVVLVVDVDHASLDETETPRRIRLTWRGKKIEPPPLGAEIAVVADLSPLPRPAAPGAFDYGRQLYFESIGATGRIKSLQVRSFEVPSRFALRSMLHDLRTVIGERIKQSIPSPLGAVAEALVTGERASIPRAMNESLQASGLFHILSISGLHMTLVAGGAFWALRALLALSPRLALQYPIKKWAAAMAIVVGLFYMLLADGGAATQRAFVMIAIVFFAVLVDRPAISLHNLAVAAVVILLWQPEQAVSASFQMSFLAVMGLAAFYPVWSYGEQRLWPMQQSGLIAFWSRRIVLLFVASLFTSLIAGGFSGLAAAHHFGRVAPYGVIANALALPVTGVVIMPMAMLAVLLMPFGLEGLPLQVMQWGLDVLMWISDWVASWRGASMQMPLLPVNATVFAALAAAFLCLSASWLRVVSIPLAISSLFFAMETKPLVLVDDRGTGVAVMTDAGLAPVFGKYGAQNIGRWLDIYGDTARPQDAAKRVAWECPPTLCRTYQQGRKIVYLKREHETKVTCPSADILVAAFPLRRRCKGKLATIDRFDVWRNGAYAVWADGEANTSRSVQGKRPWTYEPRARVK